MTAGSTVKLPGMRRFETVRWRAELARDTPLLSFTVTVTFADPEAAGVQASVAAFPLTHPWGRPFQA